jgi:hypothetical protein
MSAGGRHDHSDDNFPRTMFFHLIHVRNLYVREMTKSGTKATVVEILGCESARNKDPLPSAVRR